MEKPLQSKAKFTRWYDMKPEMSQAVRMLADLSPAYQRLICQTVILQVERDMTDKKFDGSLKKLGSDKILGLFKSKSKRRWYDEDPMIHKAFNYLYLMEDGERHEAALKIIIAINALQLYFEDAEADPNLAAPGSQPMVQAIFDQTLETLKEKTALIPMDLGKGAGSPLNLSSLPVQPPPQQGALSFEAFDEYEVLTDTTGLLIRKNEKEG